MILPLLLTSAAALSTATASVVTVNAFYPAPSFFPGLSLRGEFAFQFTITMLYCSVAA